MERLIHVGLQRMEKDVAAKQKVGDVLQTVKIVKGMVGTAVQAAPEAAVAWVGVSFALEVSSPPRLPPSADSDRYSRTRSLSRASTVRGLPTLCRG
jgi:hypothetical protein